MNAQRETIKKAINILRASLESKNFTSLEEIESSSLLSETDKTVPYNFYNDKKKVIY